MMCCSLIVATSLLLARTDGYPDRATGGFSTPMFLRGQPVWVTRISRRQLLIDHAANNARPPARQVDVAQALT